MAVHQPTNIQHLVDALQTCTKALDESSDKDEARKTALKAAQDVVVSLQKPEDVIMRYVNELLGERMSLKLGADLGIFRLLLEANGPITSSELAERTKAEELLIVRLMRIICNISFAKEVGVRCYEATTWTAAMTNPGLEGALYVSHTYEATSKIPAFLKEKGYRCPTKSTDSPFQFTYKTDLPYFTYIHQSEEGMKAFNDFMGVIRAGRKFWADWFDIESKVLKGYEFEDGHTLLVDIGGGNGHDLENFLQRYPQSAGHLVLEDLGTTISGLDPTKLSDGIRPVVYDFFQEQPITGAKVYYMHFCLHDWPDEDCRTILRRIMAAMKPGYSTLLLNEAVLPDINCPPWFSTNDINMMAIMSGIQRTREHWVQLMESVGLECTNVWESPYEDDAEGVIEARLKT